MSEKSFSQTPIVYRAEPITRSQVDRFVQATGSEFCAGAPPLTFATILRGTEFKWLERLKIDMRGLLHTDQEYEYVAPMKEGDVPTVYSSLVDYKERRGLVFVSLESEVRCGEQVAVIARSAFVVRSAAEGGAA